MVWYSTKIEYLGSQRAFRPPLEYLEKRVERIVTKEESSPREKNPISLILMGLRGSHIMTDQHIFHRSVSFKLLEVSTLVEDDWLGDA